MLNETPLGTMLEEVASQLLDKVLTFVPNHKLSGSEIVALTKRMFPRRLGLCGQHESEES